MRSNYVVAKKPSNSIALPMGAPPLLTVGADDNETVETRALIAKLINLHMHSFSSWAEYKSV